MPMFPVGGSGYLPRYARGGLWGILVPVVILAILFWAVTRERPAEGPTPTPAAPPTFTPTLEQLPPVPSGHYELWAQTPAGGSARLLAFTALPGGSLQGLNGEPVTSVPVHELPPSGSVIFLTVEPGSAPAETPSARILLRGELAQTEAALAPVVPAREGKHTALLLTPTDAAAPDTAGVWFGRPSGARGRTAAGLALPDPGEGWAYGGFVTTAAGTTLRTGLFRERNAADTESPTSGGGKGLPVPGEDFLRNAPEGVTFPLNLADGRTTVAVSLLPDFATAAEEPFVPLLKTRIPYQQKTGEPFVLSTVDDADLPRGNGTFSRSEQ